MMALLVWELGHLGGAAVLPHREVSWGHSSPCRSYSGLVPPGRGPRADPGGPDLLRHSAGLGTPLTFTEELEEVFEQREVCLTFMPTWTRFSLRLTPQLSWQLYGVIYGCFFNLFTGYCEVCWKSLVYVVTNRKVRTVQSVCEMCVKIRKLAINIQPMWVWPDKFTFSISILVWNPSPSQQFPLGRFPVTLIYLNCPGFFAMLTFSSYRQRLFILCLLTLPWKCNLET